MRARPRAARLLYSQGIPLEDLGVPTRDGTPVERDHRRIWQRFADHFYLFRATPTGLWLATALIHVFGVEEILGAANAQRIYDQIAAQLARPDFAPHALFACFNIAYPGKVTSTRPPRGSGLPRRAHPVPRDPAPPRQEARWSRALGHPERSLRPAAHPRPCERDRGRAGAGCGQR